MIVYDITQESTTCQSYPGVEPAQRIMTQRIADGEPCNVSKIIQMAHNGTHCDAPLHFIEGGKAIDEVPVDVFVGECVLVERKGLITAECAKEDIALGSKRVIYKGDVEMTEEGAKVFASSDILLIGNESSTFGPVSAPAAVHRILLGAEICLLEGIRTPQVPAGRYIISAAPISYKGSDGCPCRAVLIDVNN